VHAGVRLPAARRAYEPTVPLYPWRHFTGDTDARGHQEGARLELVFTYNVGLVNLQ